MQCCSHVASGTNERLEVIGELASSTVLNSVARVERESRLMVLKDVPVVSTTAIS
jgi:hypothetical protein